MKDIIFLTATALASAIREKQVSAMEVLEAHLAHIAKHNPLLNAIVTLDAEGAVGVRRLPIPHSHVVKYGGRYMGCH